MVRGERSRDLTDKKVQERVELWVVTVLVWALLGALGSRLYVTAIIHEIGHWIVCTMQGARPMITRWNYIEADFFTTVSAGAGYVLESLFWCIMVFVGLVKVRYWLVGFGLGHTLHVLIFCTDSMDANVIRKLGGEPFGMQIFIFVMLFLTAVIVFPICLERDGVVKRLAKKQRKPEERYVDRVLRNAKAT